MTDQPLRIVSLVAENVKRLKAVRIDPKGNMVRITGRNAQGKTSILESIFWALAGAGVIQKAPIRNGEQSALIKLDLGELKVVRKFERTDAGDFTTSISVENGEGMRAPSPQKLLNAMLDELALDPLEFSRMKAEEQFELLKRFVPGVDFAAIEKANATDFAERTNVNRKAGDARTRAAAIMVPAEVPAERVDEQALIDELAAVGEHNGEIEARKLRREQAELDAATKRNDAAALKAKAERLRKEAEECDRIAGERIAEAEALEKKLADAGPLPEPKDKAEVQARLTNAKAANAALDAVARRDALTKEALDHEKRSEELTAAMDARKADMRKAIAEAKLPVEGIGFGEKHITLNGVPFEQASSAEQLRASMAIAMARKPRLRVIRVREGSLLDDEGMRIIAEMAEASDFQVWIESVDSSGKVGFVIEDGQVRHTPADDAAAQAAE